MLMNLLLIIAALLALGLAAFWIFSFVIVKLRGASRVSSKDAGRWNAIPIAQAKLMCLPLLMDESKFSVTESQMPPGTYSYLAPMQAELFERFESIQPRFGDMRLDRRLIERSQSLPGMIRIGTDAGEYQIVTK